MSRYLIRCLEVLPNVTVRTRTQIVALEGSERHLERVRWRNEATGEEETRGMTCAPKREAHRRGGGRGRRLRATRAQGDAGVGAPGAAKHVPE